MELKFRLKLTFNSKTKVTKDALKQFIETNIKGISIKNFSVIKEEKDELMAEIESNLKDILLLEVESYDKSSLVKESMEAISDKLLCSINILPQQLKAQNINNTTILKQIGKLKALAEVNYEKANKEEFKSFINSNKDLSGELNLIIHQLNEELKKVNQENEKLIEERDVFASHSSETSVENIRELKDKMADLEQKYMEKAIEQTNLENLCNQLTNQLSEKTLKVSELKKLLTEARIASTKEGTSTNDELTQLKEQIKQDKDNMNAIISMLKQKIVGIQSPFIQSIRSKVESVTGKCLLLEKKVSVLERYLDDNRKKEKNVILTSVKAFRKGYTEAMDNTSKAIEHLSFNISKKKESIVKMKEHHARYCRLLRDEIDKMLRENEELKEKIDEQEAERTKLEEIIEMQKTQVNKMIVDITLLHETCNKLTISQTEMNKEILRVNNLKAELCEQYNKEQQAFMIESQREKLLIKSSLSTFIIRVNNVIEEIKSAVEKIHNKIVIKKIINSISKLHKELNKTKVVSTSDEENLKVKKLKEKKKQLKKQVEQYEVILKEKDTSIEQLNKKVIELSNLVATEEEKNKLIKDYFELNKEQYEGIIKRLKSQFRIEYIKLKDFMLNKLETISLSVNVGISSIIHNKASNLLKIAGEQYTKVIEELKSKHIELQGVIANKESDLMLIKKEVNDQKSKAFCIEKEAQEIKLMAERNNAQVKDIIINIKENIGKNLQEIFNKILTLIINNDHLDRLIDIMKKAILKYHMQNDKLKIAEQAIKEELEKSKEREETLEKTRNEIKSLSLKLASSEQEIHKLNENIEQIKKEYIHKEEELKLIQQELEVYKERESTIEVKELVEESKVLSEHISQIQKVNSELNIHKTKLREAENKFKQITNFFCNTIKYIESTECDFSTPSFKITHPLNFYNIASIITEYSPFNELIPSSSNQSETMNSRCSVEKCKNYEEVLRYKGEVEKLQGELIIFANAQNEVQRKSEVEVEVRKHLEAQRESYEEFKSIMQNLEEEFVNIKRLLNDNKEMPKEISFIQNTSIKLSLLNVKQGIESMFTEVPISLNKMLLSLENTVQKTNSLLKLQAKFKMILSQLMKERQNLEITNNNLRTSLKDKEAMMEELKKENEKAKSEVINSQEKIKILLDQKQKLEEAVEGTSNNNTYFRKLIEDKHNNITQLGRQLQNLEASNERLNKELRTKEKLIDKITSDSETLIKQLHSNIKEKDNRIVRLESNYKEDMKISNEVIRNLNKQAGEVVIERERIASEYKNELNKLITKINTQEKEIENYKKKRKPITQEGNYKALIENVKKKEQDIKLREEQLQVVIEDNKKNISILIGQRTIIQKEYEDYKVQTENTIKQIGEALIGKFNNIDNGIKVSHLRALKALLQIIQSENRRIKERVKTFKLPILTLLESYNATIIKICKKFNAVENKRYELYKEKIERLETFKKILNDLIGSKAKENIISKCLSYFPYLKESIEGADMEIKANCLIATIKHKRVKFDKYKNEEEEALSNIKLSSKHV